MNLSVQGCVVCVCVCVGGGGEGGKLVPSIQTSVKFPSL